MNNPELWSLNLNTILILAGFLFTAGAFYYGTKSDLKQIKLQIKLLTEAMTKIAVQDNRLDNQENMITAIQRQQVTLDSRVYELSRGRGFVRTEIDGEYHP